MSKAKTVTSLRNKFGLTRRPFWQDSEFGALVACFFGAIGLAMIPIFFYPITHLDHYKKIQKIARAGINQQDIQPGNMKVWSDPFDRKKET